MNIEEKWNLVIKQIEALKQDYDLIEKRINGNIALFGAGQFGTAAFEYLKNSKYRVICFIDNAPQKQGMKIDGIPVVSLNDELLKSTDIILITAKHAVDSIKLILDKNKPSMSFDSWFVIKNIKKYQHLKDQIFGDTRSKECLIGVMLAMLTGNEEFCASIMDFNQYFCLPQFVNRGDEYFVDAGAYVGDGVEKFIWANNGGFKHIYAFEPGNQQFDALVKRKLRLLNEWALDENDITLVNAGLGEHESFATININKGHLLGANLTVNATDEDGSGIQVFSLDDFIKDNKVTFIKADIEGMEMEMLKGAIKTIEKNQPKMALSVYHKPDDLFVIIDFILKINKEYRIEIRHHSPLLMDTTIYCWIP